MDGFAEKASLYVPLIFMPLLLIALFFAIKQGSSRGKAKMEKIKPEDSGGVKWEDVAGCEAAKAELQEVVSFLVKPEQWKHLGARVPRGVILHGPPGTGKTMLAKAVASEANAHFYAMSASAFVEMYAGVGAARIRSLFKAARKGKKTSIVFIDEIDAIGKKRSSDPSSNETSNTLNQLLTEMDGFSTKTNVIVIAASNLISALDPALLRPGRFDRHVLISQPDMAGRKAILEVHTKDKPLENIKDLEEVARQTSGLAGADLANIANEAAIFAGREKRTTITKQDFSNALERITAGVASNKLILPKEKAIVAHHEAGHALASELLPSINKVHKISIVPRGEALGYAINLPGEDRYLKTADELEDLMVMLLAGRASEQIIFGKTTTGASNDLEKVYELSRQMITDYGFGKDLGMSKLPAGDYSMSESTRTAIDKAQQEITEKAWQRALDLMDVHSEEMKALAEALLKQEVIERDQIVAICKDARERQAKEFAEKVIGSRESIRDTLTKA